MRKDELINSINKLQKNDSLINELFNAIGIELDKNDIKISNCKSDLFIDTASINAIVFYEKEASIKPRENQSINDRRAGIEAKWKSGGKIGERELQTIADSWKNGAIAVIFNDTIIKINFISAYGQPEDLINLKKALEEAKPAHLPIEYIFIYITHEQIALYMHEQIALYTHEQIRNGGMIDVN